MAFDEALAERVRAAIGALTGKGEVEEKRMFGGLAFMVRGHMSVGILDDRLMVRLPPGDAEAALRRSKHVAPMDFTGKPLKGFLYVEPQGHARAADLRKWVSRGVAHARSLPPRP